MSRVTLWAKLLWNVQLVCPGLPWATCDGPSSDGKFLMALFRGEQEGVSVEKQVLTSQLLYILNKSCYGTESWFYQIFKTFGICWTSASSAGFSTAYCQLHIIEITFRDDLKDNLGTHK